MVMTIGNIDKVRGNLWPGSQGASGDGTYELPDGHKNRLEVVYETL